jgi:hypothetical protein
MPTPRRRTTDPAKPAERAPPAPCEEDLAQRISVAAYFLAEKRGFVGTEEDAMRDWLEAEAQIRTDGASKADPST